MKIAVTLIFKASLVVIDQSLFYLCFLKFWNASSTTDWLNIYPLQDYKQKLVWLSKSILVVYGFDTFLDKSS